MVETFFKKSFKQLENLEWKNIFNMFYIEPVLLMLVFAHSLSGTIIKHQVLYQACTSVYLYNETDCAQLGTDHVNANQTAIETEIQPYVANLFMMRTILESIVPAICGVFIGSWSDHYGRKPLLVISMVGFSCTYVITAVICEISKYYLVNPWWYILAVIPHSILGGNCVFSVAAFCFVSDVTTQKSRPYRMIFLEGFLFVGLTSGSLLSSYVYKATGATVTFMISGVIMWIATIYIIFWVPESLNYKIKEDLDEGNEKEKSTSKGNGTDNDTMTKQPTPVLTNCCLKDLTALELEKAGDLRSSLEKDEIKELTNTGDIKAKSDKAVQNQNGVVNGKDNPAFEESEEITKASQKKPLEKYSEFTPPISKNNNNEESEKTDHSEKEKEANGEAPSGETKKSPGLFSIEHIKDMLRICFKERPCYDRAIIWLVTLTMFMQIFVIDGVMTVFYLYVREKFHWTVKDFTVYETVHHSSGMIGAILGVVILRKIFKMSIVSLTALALFSNFCSNIVIGFASDTWHLYLAVGIGIFRSISGPMCRTIVSNIVPGNDLGKIFSIKNVLQSIAPFIAAPLYTVIYNVSLTTNPGLFNFLSAVLYVISLIFILIVWRYKCKNKEHYATILK